MKLGSGITLLLVVLFMTVSCSGDDAPSQDTIITGNTEFVDLFEVFNPPRRGTLSEEFRSSQRNTKVFADSLDLDGNGIYDLKTEYIFAKSISGDTTVVTRMIQLHENMFFLGDTVRFGGQIYWEQRIYEEGKTVGSGTDFWESRPESGHPYDFDYWLKFESSGFIDDLTKFPESRQGYLVFKLLSGNETLIGWLKIKLALPGRVPEIEEIGYRLF
ncbi:MAG: hypothetical protein HEP71_14400 [Roseivirga sp.]|nr:hypothetical protein [Roseivirga sp.]